MKYQGEREQLAKTVRLYQRGLLNFSESLHRIDSIISGLQDTDYPIQMEFEKEKLFRYGLNLLVKQSARRWKKPANW